MKRRDCLKGSALLLGGALVSACDGQSADQGPAAAGAGDDRVTRFDRGTPPIETSGWVPAAGELKGYSALDGDIDTDVAVVGAGLAGSSLALHLAEAGLDVVVLEARQPGWGASGRNAGHVLPTLKNREVFKRFPDGGKQFLDIFRQHHTITFDLARKHGIACDAAQTGYLHATDRASTFEALSEEADYWQREQGQRIERVGTADMARMTGSDYYSHGVWYASGGRVNPYLLSNGLVAAAVGHGARVFGGTEALTLTAVGGRWRVSTPAGSVTAQRVVFCTNAYATGIVPAFADSFYPLTAYGVATQPLPQAALDLIMPSRATLAQEPVDLNPMVIDERGRLITSSIPSQRRPADADWHFKNHLRWIHRTWPQTRDMDIQWQHYWTGRVALRDQEFPGVYAVQPGVFGGTEALTLTA
ncbi:MAG TPA: FAD-dependent oxidoreductase, partial [Spongiibacteraceae bacterium]|nr:FAD-dependent oxidoreductase [Spongiibacteraceae bacterium]